MEKNRLVERFLDDSTRDTVLIFPGGGYQFTSHREALPIVARLHALGLHGVVCEYRHEHLIHPEVVAEAIAFADHVRRDRRVGRLFAMGFSAGGHLALHLVEKRPRWFAGLILAYPVVTTRAGMRHDGSIASLLGADRSETRLRQVSLELHVPKAMPPVFLWHTMEDATVPVANALRLVAALRTRRIPVEVHLFPKGVHGLALADATTPWDTGDPQAYAAENAHVATWFGLFALWLYTL